MKPIFVPGDLPDIHDHDDFGKDIIEKALRKESYKFYVPCRRAMDIAHKISLMDDRLISGVVASAWAAAEVNVPRKERVPPLSNHERSRLIKVPSITALTLWLARGRLVFLKDGKVFTETHTSIEKEDILVLLDRVEKIVGRP